MASNKFGLRVLVCEHLKNLLKDLEEMPLSNIYISMMEKFGIDPYFVDRVMQPYIDAGTYAKQGSGSKCVIINVDFKYKVTQRKTATPEAVADLILSAKPIKNEPLL